MSLTIKAFYAQEKNDSWVLLPETSEYLTDKQIIPNTGDAITLAGKDGQVIGIEPTSFKHIMTVKIKWFNYANADLAIVLHYVSF